MKKLIACLTALTLTACALPKNEAELVAKNQTSHFCHQDTVENTNNKLYSRLAKCYNYSSSVPVMTETSYGYTSYSTVNTVGKVLSKPANPGEFIYLIVTGGSGQDYYGLRLELKEGEGESCPTQLNTHVMNFAWERHVDRIQLWLDDPEEGCGVW